MSIISRALCALSLAGVAAVASACASSSSSDPPAAGSDPGHAPLGVVLNVGDQQQELQTLFQASHAGLLRL